MNFQGFPKMARLSREVIITEKIDGTNACIVIGAIPKLSEGDPDWPSPHQPERIAYWYGMDGSAWGIWAGSRTRWVTPENDNYGFAKWVKDHVEELKLLGSGRHFGEWWGQGIQRNYGLKEKRFSLFNPIRWHLKGDKARCISVNERGEPKMQQPIPKCVGLVPTISSGIFTSELVDSALNILRKSGSNAVPGFMNPEGIVIYHTAGNVSFKKTLEKDSAPKNISMVA